MKKSRSKMRSTMRKAMFIAAALTINPMLAKAALAGPAALIVPAIVAFASTALGAAIIGSVLSVGLSLIASAILTKPKSAAAPRESGGQSFYPTLVNIKQAAAPRQVVYGRIRTGGTIVFADTSDNNLWINLIIVISTHEIEAFEEFWINDEQHSLPGNPTPPGGYELALGGDATPQGYFTAGGKTVAYPGGPSLVYVQFHTGTDTQAADDGAITSMSPPFGDGTNWTSTDQLKGMAYIYVRLQHGPMGEQQPVFSDGLPNLTVVVRGHNHIWDPRTETYGYSSNAALCANDFITNTLYGMGFDQSAVDQDVLAASANLSDETVDHGDFTWARYTCNGAFTTDLDPQEVLGRLLATMHGYAPYDGDKWRIIAAAHYASSYTIYDTDLRGGPTVQTLISKRDMFNSIKGTYLAANRGFQESDFQPIQSAAFLAEDGGIETWQDITLPFTIHDAVAQQLAKIELELSRRRLGVYFPGKLNLWNVHAGDTVTWNSELFDFEQEFEVKNVKFIIDGQSNTIGIDLELIETDAEFYEWTEADVLVGDDPGTGTSDPDANTVLPASNLTATEVLYETAPGAAVRSNLVIEWDASEDALVGWYQVEYKLHAATDWIIRARINALTDTIPDLDTGSWDVRVAAVNSIGNYSTFIQVTATVSGDTTVPANPAGLVVVATAAGWATLRWTPTTEERVRNTGFVEIRYQAVTSGATWAAATVVAVIAGNSDTYVVRAAIGTYLIKFKSSTAVYSTSPDTEVLSTLEAPITGVEIVGTLPVTDLYDGRTVFLTTDGKIYRYDLTLGSWTSGLATTDLTGTLPSTVFPSTLRPIEVVGSLPSTGNFQGRVVMLTTDNKIYRWMSATTTGTTFWVATVATTDLTGTLAASLFSSTVRPIEVVGALPSTGNFQGRLIFLTTDGKLYRWTDSSTTGTSFWVATVATTDLTGTLGSTLFSTSLRPIEVVSSLPSTGNFLGRIIFLTTDGKLYRWTDSSTTGTSFWTAVVATSDLTGTLSSSLFPSTLRPVEVVSSLPSTGNFQGRVIFLTTDGKLYRWTDTSTTGTTFWTAVVATSDLTGTLSSSLFPSTLRPVEVVGALPSTGNFQGRVILLTTDNKLYRWTSATTTGTTFWTTAVAAVDLTGQITTTQITDDSISTAKIQALAITAAKIAAATITSNEIAADTITAGNIAAGAITASEIAAKTITADKIAIGDTDNRAVNGDFAQGATGWGTYSGTTYTATPPTNASITASNGYNSSGFHLAIASGATTATLTQNANLFQVIPGEVYYLSAVVQAVSTPSQSLLVRVRFFDSAGSVVANAGTNSITFTSADSSYTSRALTSSADVVVPSGALYGLVEVVPAGTISGGSYRVGQVVCLRRNSGNLIVDGTITAGKIAADTITSNEIAANAITSGEIAAGAVVASKIAAKTITADKIAIGDTDNRAVNGDFAQGATGWGTYSGTTYTATPPTNTSITASNGYNSSGFHLAIAAGATTSNIVQNANMFQVIPGEVYYLSATVQAVTSPAQSLLVRVRFFDSAGSVVANAGTNSITFTSADSSYTSRALTSSADVVVPSGAIFGRVEVVMNTGPLSGGSYRVGQVLCLRRNSGNLIVDGTITAGKIAADTITSNEIAANAITSGEIAAGAVVASKIAADTITSNEIASNAITSNELAANSVVAGKIAAGVVTATEIAAHTITAAVIAADTITSNEIAANAITATEIAADAVTTSKILAGAVSTDKLAARSISASKILMSDLDNRAENGDFGLGVTAWGTWSGSTYTSGTPSGHTITAGDGYNGSGYHLLVSGAASSVKSQNVSLFPVTVGDTYFLRAAVKRNSTPSQSLQIKLVFYDGSMAVVAPTPSTAATLTFAPTDSTSYAEKSISSDAVIVPTTAVYGLIEISVVTGTLSGGTYQVGAVYAAKRDAADLTVDGTITANKIRARSITMDRLVIGNFTSLAENGNFIAGTLGWGTWAGANATVTMTIASPGVITWTAHGLSAGAPVKFTTTGALPTGITAGTIYYVATTSLAADTFKVSDTEAHALAGTNIVNTSGSQSGVHTGYDLSPKTFSTSMPSANAAVTAGNGYLGSGYHLLFNTGATAADVVWNSNKINVIAGEVYAFRAVAQKVSSPNLDLTVRLAFYDVNNVEIAGTGNSLTWTSADSTSYTEKLINTTSTVVPSTAVYAIAQAYLSSGTLSGGTWRVGLVFAAQRNTAELIVDGSIIAAKLSVATLSAITADLGTITAGSITSAEIKTSSGTSRIEVNAAANAIYLYMSSTLVGIIGGPSPSSGAIQIGSPGSGYYPGWFYNGSTSGGTGGTGRGAMYLESEGGHTLEVKTNTTSAGSDGVWCITASNVGSSGGDGYVGASFSTGGWAFYAQQGAYGPFTGAHDGLMSLADDTPDQGDILIDLEVVRGTISDVLTTVTRSSAPNQFALGVFVHSYVPVESTAPAAMMDQTWVELEGDPTGRRKFPVTLWSSYVDNHVVAIVNAVGEGQINVCGENGNIVKGDLIVTSNMPGKGMKQSDDIIRSYTVARARENVTFATPDEVKRCACIYLCG